MVFPIVYAPEVHFSEFKSSVADMKNSVAVSCDKFYLCKSIWILLKQEGHNILPWFVVSRIWPLLDLTKLGLPLSNTDLSQNRSNAQCSCAGLFIGAHLFDDYFKPSPIVWIHVDMAYPVHIVRIIVLESISIVLHLSLLWPSEVFSVLVLLGTT